MSSSLPSLLLLPLPPTSTNNHSSSSDASSSSSTKGVDICQVKNRGSATATRAVQKTGRKRKWEQVKDTNEGASNSNTNNSFEEVDALLRKGEGSDTKRKRQWGKRDKSSRFGYASTENEERRREVGGLQATAKLKKMGDYDSMQVDLNGEEDMDKELSQKSEQELEDLKNVAEKNWGTSSEQPKVELEHGLSDASQVVSPGTIERKRGQSVNSEKSKRTRDSVGLVSLNRGMEMDSIQHGNELGKPDIEMKHPVTFRKEGEVTQHVEDLSKLITQIGRDIIQWQIAATTLTNPVNGKSITADEANNVVAKLEVQQAEFKVQQAKAEDYFKILRQQQLTTSGSAFVMPPFPKQPSLLAEYVGVGKFSYIKSEAYEMVFNMLLKIRKAYPSKELATFEYPIIAAAMGVGKTRLGEEVATALAGIKDGKFPNGGVALRVNVGKFCQKLLVWDIARADFDALLGAAIFHAVFPEGAVPISVTLPLVAERVLKDWGTNLIVLHLDEFADSTDLVKNILKACNYTTSSSKILVLPITTGVRPAHHWDVEGAFRGTNTIPVDVPLKRFALPIITAESPFGDKTDFEAEFARAVGFQWEVYVKCESLRYLYRDCGGHPRIAQRLAELINDDSWNAKREVMLNSGELSLPEAKALFESLMKEVRVQYGLGRWHEVVRYKEGKAGGRGSDKLSTVPLLRRVLLCAFTDRPVRTQQRVLQGFILKEQLVPKDQHVKLSEATYDTCASSGLVDLKPVANQTTGTSSASTAAMNTGFFTVTSPLIALLATNELVNTLPSANPSANPFDQSPYVHEELGMTTLYLRLMAAREFEDKHTLLTALRPGALVGGTRDVWVEIPGSELNLTKAEVHISKQTSFPMWLLMVTADRQKAVDAVGMMRGGRGGTAASSSSSMAASAAAATLIILWVAQMKKRELKVPNTGSESTTVITETDIVTFVPEMRSVADQVCQKLIATSGGACRGGKQVQVHVVFDVFTDRLPPTRNPSLTDVKLKPNETLFVTTAREFPSVVGEAFAARQRMSKLAQQRR